MMKKARGLIGTAVLVSFSILGATVPAAQPRPQQSRAPEWNAAAIKECDRACLVGIMDGYMNAIFKHDPKAVPPLALDVRMTENTGQMDVGDGMLWRSKVEPTSFEIYVADPIAGQVAEQARLKIQGRDALVAVRLKIDRGKILEIEQLWDRNINQAAIPLLTTPRETLVNDVPASQRTSREVMIWAANSYFDALEGDDGGIAAFADDCVRHENGYQTVNNPPPGGRMMPAPMLPDPNTEQGKEQLKFSMMTCKQQIDSKTFAYMKHIRPRRALIVDEQKGLVATFPLFVHDGTRRGAPPDAPPGMLQNLVTMETFGIRGGLIHEVEVFPFVTIPYGLGNGWTIGSGR
ncbi:MAG TPA: hypothetical protein VJO53_02845 [Candidatus Acidoferrales bacterium]|nr:hypothetical protein [Candidatus Acidoferrales bacterium]